MKSETTTLILKRAQALETQLTRLLGGWLPGIVRWETKHAVALHLWENIQHAREVRGRLWDLRVTNPDRDVAADLAAIVRAAALAGDDLELIAGVYLVLVRALRETYAEVVRTTYKVYDAPTVPVLKRIIADKDAQLAWAEALLEAEADSGEKKLRIARWQTFVREAFDAHGGLRGEKPDNGATVVAPEPPPGHAMSLLPFPEARRDGRFRLSLTGMPQPDEGDRVGRTVYQFFNYAQEMQAAETLGSALWEADGMPWEFYHDVARHCCDEARHSKLGETRLAELGHHVTDFPNTVANYAWRQLIDPMRRYCLLTYVIEADSFRYKHESYQRYLAEEDIESAEAVLYDITDETLHVRLGKKWTPELMKCYHHPGTVDELVDECRGLLLKHSVNPVQRAGAEAARKTARPPRETVDARGKIPSN